MGPHTDGNYSPLGSGGKADIGTKPALNISAHSMMFRFLLDLPSCFCMCHVHGCPCGEQSFCVVMVFQAWKLIPESTNNFHLSEYQPCTPPVVFLQQRIPMVQLCDVRETDELGWRARSQQVFQRDIKETSIVLAGLHLVT